MVKSGAGVVIKTIKYFNKNYLELDLQLITN